MIPFFSFCVFRIPRPPLILLMDGENIKDVSPGNSYSGLFFFFVLVKYFGGGRTCLSLLCYAAASSVPLLEKYRLWFLWWSGGGGLQLKESEIVKYYSVSFSTNTFNASEHQFLIFEEKKIKILQNWISKSLKK